MYTDINVPIIVYGYLGIQLVQVGQVFSYPEGFRMIKEVSNYCYTE